MRAEKTASVQGERSEPPQPKQTFARALAQARPGPLAPGGALAARSTGHAATAHELQRARAGHAAEAHRLSEVRADQPTSAAAAQRDAGERLAQAIERNLPPVPDLPAVPVQPTAAEGGRAPAEAPAAALASRVESALALVERIEVFLRSGAPQLELSVGGQLRAEVLLERTGPREVAVTVRGRNGPPPPQELARIRDGLRLRGLKLSSLAIA